VGINSNPIAAGSADAAPASFQPRAAGPSAGPVANDPNTNSAASQASDASSSNASGSAQGTGAVSGNGQSGSSSASSAPKTTGPSAQTMGNTRARTSANAATSASAPSAADPLETVANSSTDFGSVMATTLGRSATNTAAPSTSARAVNDASTTTGATASGQQAPTPAGTGVDAIAWIAQALMPTSTPAVAPISDESAAESDAHSAVGTLVANTAGAGQSASTSVSASLARFNATTVPQVPTTQTTDTQTAATNLATAATSGDINTLADIQKLIAGLTGASSTDTDSDSDAAAATSTTHSPATSDSSEATQAAALQAASLTRSGTSVGSATLTIHAPVGSAAFADEVGARVAGLSQSGITQAQLQLNPADMGPVQVHITMQAGQASVWFGAAHADTRAALEQSLPRLRELFAGAGMPLTDSGVFREPPQQQQAQSLPTSGSSLIPGSDTVSAPTVTQVSNIRLALLDTYA
jgi:flagellar hook-length control protein FliK